ncbi:hypothetical protein, partial [Mycobacterium marinum]|uniref:hypothetical protein n=1 Tax=Mycobacterium marinum TaxID=1781 RepID=UPI0035671DA8
DSDITDGELYSPRIGDEYEQNDINNNDVVQELSNENGNGGEVELVQIDPDQIDLDGPTDVGTSELDAINPTHSQDQVQIYQAYRDYVEKLASLPGLDSYPAWLDFDVFWERSGFGEWTDPTFTNEYFKSYFECYFPDLLDSAQSMIRSGFSPSDPRFAEMYVVDWIKLPNMISGTPAA